MMKLRSNKKGFTLVELLMVVIIIGVLVTIAIPNYTRAVERSKGSKAKGTLDAIRKAQLQYRALNDEYADMMDLLAEVDLPQGIIDDSDTDWGYSIDDATPDTLLVTATRIAGPFASETITIDHEGKIDKPAANENNPW